MNRKLYNRGPGVRTLRIKSNLQKEYFHLKELEYKDAELQSFRSESLLTETSGFIESENDEFTYELSQNKFKKCVDLCTASKIFDLTLKQFAPYKIDYLRNGRYVLLGGKMGHVAAFEWLTKTLKCEFNVMESVHDVKWMHTESMFAVAQKKWVYFYDLNGIELHCLKNFHKIACMEFLPYHFLLVASSETGFLHWFDISIGKIVNTINTHMSQLGVMCQNPQNAVICLGNAKGVISMWIPSMKGPVLKMLCHTCPLRSVAVDIQGNYLITSGMDRLLKVWDIRNFSCLQSYKLGGGASKLSFSQTGLLAAALGNGVEVYKDLCIKKIESPYMRHNCHRTVTDIQFCPFEDVLGIGHGTGFSSLIIPGAGEPNFDALEANPFQTKKQRQEAEVKALLEKIQPELISLDTGELGDVDQEKLKAKLDEKNALPYLKPDKLLLGHRHRNNQIKKSFSCNKEVDFKKSTNSLKKFSKLTTTDPKKFNALYRFKKKRLQ